MTLTTADIMALSLSLTRAECNARTDHAVRWQGKQLPGTATPTPEEYEALKAHAAHWQARRRELQAMCGAAGLHDYRAAYGDVIDTRACRLCGALEPRK